MTTKIDWIARVHELGPELAAHDAQCDDDGSFVAKNYEILKAERFLSVAVPEEMGGGGLGHAELCNLLRELALYTPSTALAFSMHSHLVAATVWKHRHGQGGEPLLRRVADEQLVLLSTGGTDWIDSNGLMKRVDGGYRVTGRKVFGSGSPAADMMLSSARYEDPDQGWQVLHFAAPMKAEGVKILDDWNAFGMRGTGSNTVLLEDVFVPDEAVALTRPAGQWHPVWSVIAVVALPILLSPYVGLAEKARGQAIAEARKKTQNGDPFVPLVIGEIEDRLMAAQLAWRDMIRTANDYDFEPALELANRTVIQKTLLSQACVGTVQKAMEACGGRGFFCGFGMEKLLRDVMAVAYHPLTEKRQQVFSGRFALGLEPITGQPMA